MSFWASGFWASGFWQPDFWAEESAVYTRERITLRSATTQRVELQSFVGV